MKKLVGLLLVLVMVVSAMGLAACSKTEIPDEMTSSDGKYEIAMITDIGDLKDGSFNEGTWEGTKTYASNNKKSYKYYQPANGKDATDTDRVDAFNLAIKNGAKVIVCPGFAFGDSIAQVSTANPDVKFVFIDGWNIGNKNLVGVAFQEEQCGYLAGYAAVMEGYTKLGYTGGGGGTNSACNRYGFGYVQGVNDAAKAKGVKVEVRYSNQFGSSFSASAELQSQMNGWYTTGTEIVFACGGSMFQSVSAAAAANKAKTIGVDVDQSSQSDTVVTSAMKGLKEAVEYALNAFYKGEWDTKLADKILNLGANDDAVGLPTATWSMTKFTVKDYEALLAKIKNGSVKINNASDLATIQSECGKMSNVTFKYE